MGGEERTEGGRTRGGGGFWRQNLASFGAKIELGREKKGQAFPPHCLS
jgi:hypothetical protein